MNKKKILKVLGNILTVASIIGIIYLIIKLGVDLYIFLNIKFISSMIIFGIILSLAVLLNSIAWKALLTMLTNKTIKLNEIVNIYARSNINKYLPGNVMHYATRNILGVQYNIDQKSILAATIFEIIFKILCASLIVVIFVRNELNIALNSLGINTITLILFLVCIFVLAVIVIWLFARKNNVYIINSLKYIFKANIMYIIVFILNVIVFINISIIFSKYELVLSDILLTSGIYLIAWLIGYLTPGSPGGLGIRESLMILLLGSIFDYDTVITISIGVRIVTIFADIFSYIINLIYVKRGNYETNNTDTLL